MRPMRHTGAVLVAFLAFGTFWGAWASLVPSVQTAVGASKGELGLALLAVAVGALPAMSVTGLAIDRFGAIVLPASLAAIGAASILPALADSMLPLAAALFVLGAASGAADVAINAEVAALEAAGNRRLMPLAHALFSLGVIVGALAAGIARQLGAGRLAILAAAGLLLAATAWANRRPYPRVSESTPHRRRVPRHLIALGVVCAVAFVVEGGLEGWSALFLERELDAEPAVSGLGPSAFAVGMVTGRLSAQWLHRRLSDAAVLAGGACLAVIGLLAVSRAGLAGVAIGCFVLAGLGVSVAAPTLFGAAGRGAGEADRGAAVATVTTIAYLGFLAGPPLMGGVAEALGLRASFVVLAGAAAIVAVAAPRLGLR